MDYLSIENKYQDLINESLKYINKIKDPEHNINHIKDVVAFTKEILDNIDLKDVNVDACIISAYWHDVGRLYQNEGHELLSANMLKEYMIGKYPNDLIDTCFNAIKDHKWNMSPTTIEGIIIKDADKLGFIGINRWTSCNKANKKLNDIINLLPNLRNNILKLDISKEIYDKDINNIISLIEENKSL